MSAMEILVKLVRERDLLSFMKLNRASKAPPKMVFIRWVPYLVRDENGQEEESLRALYLARGDTSKIEILRLGSNPDKDVLRPAEDIAAESPNPLEELISLAHELGHHDSITRHHGSLSNSDPEETQYKEEVRAWILGRKILESEGFTDWAQFDLRMEEGLTSYQNGFSLSQNEIQNITVLAEEEILHSAMRC